tara:strand:- start:367 stop:1053 length:687 start_codon:yes stop_codon:yes gene_type:complete
MQNSATQTQRSIEITKGLWINYKDTLDAQGKALTKIHNNHVERLERGHRSNTRFNGLAWNIGRVYHELKNESDSERVPSGRLNEVFGTMKNRSQTLSECLWLFTNGQTSDSGIYAWLDERKKNLKKGEKPAFTNIGSMKKAYIKFMNELEMGDAPTQEDQDAPEAEATEANPDVGANEDGVKVKAYSIPQNERDMVAFIAERGFDLGEIASIIIDEYLEDDQDEVVNQ